MSSAPSPFSHGFNYASTDACEASRRALLSQGYMTTMTHNDTVDATKNFQPTVDQHIVVEVHVVCTPADATNTSMVYVNAVQNGYTLKKSATSASVGLSILGSVSLPIHSNSDEMVKVSSQTIQSDAFYKRFFDLVGRYLNTVARSEPVPGSGDIKSTPLPPPLEPDPALMNPVTPGVSAAPAAAAAAAAATGVAVLHNTVPPTTPVQGMQAAVPAAAASGVHAVFPASPASEATLLTPVLPAPAASAPAAATSPASTPAAASAPAGANHAGQPGAAAVPASGAAATQAAAPGAGASTTQAAAPAAGAAATQTAAPASSTAAVQAAAQPAAASAAAPVTVAAAPTSAANSGTATSSPAPAGGTQNVAAASTSGAANAPASNSATAAATAH
ncbi:DUF2242 domain-containing protein [Paraburkholderia pallida]|uniref:DUF2242 domain-containing protein n=1 Tax=Paraburkholderia pallida TaxID=2547399 RepID=UPI001E3A4BC7|nr:DUF2242 domain-containing protein [Paraburkholderia pallida]